MLQYINRFWGGIKGELYHSSLLISGNIVAQLISVATYPILTRLYSTSLFGEFSVFLSITSILAIVATARMEFALILPKEDAEANYLLKISTIWCFLFSVVCFIVTLIIGLCGTFHSKIPDLYFLSGYVFLAGVVQLLTLNQNRYKNYKTIAQASVAQNAASTGAKIVLGFTPLIKSGLLFGSFVGQIIALTVVLKGNLKIFFEKNTFRLKDAWYKYSAFPKFRMVQALINSFSSNMPIFFMTFYFSAKEAGLFALVFGLAMKVINLVSSSIYQVLYRKFSEMHHIQLSPLHVFRKIVLFLFLLSFLPSIGVYLFTKPLISIFLGQGWLEADSYIRIMLPWLILVFIASPFAFIADIYSLQKKVLWFDILNLCIRLLGLFIGVWFKNVFLSLMLYTFGSFGFQLYLIVWYDSVLRRNTSKI